MISAITPEGKLYTTILTHSFQGVDIIAFLQHLLQQMPGKLLLIWDGASIHKSKVLKAWLATLEPDLLKLVALPAYAPQLNADEGIWHYLKGVELKNVCCSDLQHLRQELVKAIKRLRQKPRLIRACVRHAEKV